MPLRNLKYSCISCVGKGVTEFLMSRRNTLPAGLSSEMFMDNSSPIQGPFRKAGRVNNPSYLHSFRVSVIAPNFFLLRRNSFSFLKRKQSYMNMRMADNKWPFFLGGGGDFTSVIYDMVAVCLCEFLSCICFPFSRALFIELIN